jgi:type II secretory pathway pseudopilin PulG
MTGHGGARADDGFTLIEVMFAMLVSTLTVIATVALLSKGSETNVSNVRQVTMTQELRRQIEQVRAIIPQSGFAAVALSSAPTGTGTTTSDPRFWLRASSTRFVIARNYLDSGSTVAAGSSAAGEKLIVSATGQVTPVTTNVAIGGGQTATVYRFVTADSQTTLCSPSCEDDSRRITIAIVPSNTNGNSTDVRGPFYLSTVITNSVPSSITSAGNGIQLGVPL